MISDYTTDDDGCPVCERCHDTFSVDFPNERNRELVKRQDQLDEVADLLAANGCDCDCDHGYDDHEDDCERCFACRVSWIVSGGP